MKQERDLLFAPYFLLVPVVIAMFFNLLQLMFKSNIKLFEVTSPLVFCFFVAICLLIFLTLSFISDIKLIKKPGYAENKSSLVENEDLIRIAVFVPGLIIYVLLLPTLHFQIATAIFMALTAFLLNDLDKISPRLVKAIISAAILVPAVYYIFYKIFAVILP